MYISQDGRTCFCNTYDWRQASEVPFARQTQGESETARQAGEALKTPSAFRSSGVERERNHGGVNRKSIWQTFALLVKCNTKLTLGIRIVQSSFKPRTRMYHLNDLRRCLSTFLQIMRFARKTANCFVLRFARGARLGQMERNST